MSSQPTLFLDFDGVLHADPVFLEVRTGKPVLDPEFGILFEWAPALDRILSWFAPVQIVLSTTWAARLGFEEARAYLPAGLASRVVDCVWRKDEYLVNGLTPSHFHQMYRFEQIEQYVKRKGLTNWLAIDNDARGWPADQRHRLVKTEDYTGLSTAPAQGDLNAKLTLLTKESDQVGRENKK